jgi:hypothetical protein
LQLQSAEVVVATDIFLLILAVRVVVDHLVLVCPAQALLVKDLQVAQEQPQ